MEPTIHLNLFTSHIILILDCINFKVIILSLKHLKINYLNLRVHVDK